MQDTRQAAGVDGGADARIQELQAELEGLQKAMTIINHLAAASDIQTAMDNVRLVSLDLLKCEKVTLFLVFERRQELRALTHGPFGDFVIHVKFGEGIAGMVAATGEMTNIEDTYSHPQFCSSVDKSTGFRTRNMLCCAIRDMNGCNVAVLQALNKHGGDKFTPADERNLSIVGTHLGNTLEKAKLHETARRERKRLSGLYTCFRNMSTADDLEELLLLARTALHDVLHAQYAFVFIHDAPRNELWTTFEVPGTDDTRSARVKVGSGVVGSVAAEKRTRVIQGGGGPPTTRIRATRSSLDMNGMLPCDTAATNTQVHSPSPSAPGTPVSGASMLARVHGSSATLSSRPSMGKSFSMSGAVSAEPSIFATGSSSNVLAHLTSMASTGRAQSHGNLNQYGHQHSCMPTADDEVLDGDLMRQLGPVLGHCVVQSVLVQPLLAAGDKLVGAILVVNKQECGSHRDILYDDNFTEADTEATALLALELGSQLADRSLECALASVTSVVGPDGAASGAQVPGRSTVTSDSADTAAGDSANEIMLRTQLLSMYYQSNKEQFRPQGSDPGGVASRTHTGTPSTASGTARSRWRRTMARLASSRHAQSFGTWQGHLDRLESRLSNDINTRAASWSCATSPAARAALFGSTSIPMSGDVIAGVTQRGFETVNGSGSEHDTKHWITSRYSLDSAGYKSGKFSHSASAPRLRAHIDHRIVPDSGRASGRLQTDAIMVPSKVRTSPFQMHYAQGSTREQVTEAESHDNADDDDDDNVDVVGDGSTDESDADEFRVLDSLPIHKSAPVVPRSVSWCSALSSHSQPHQPSKLARVSMDNDRSTTSSMQLPLQHVDEVEPQHLHEEDTRPQQQEFQFAHHHHHRHHSSSQGVDTQPPPGMPLTVRTGVQSPNTHVLSSLSSLPSGRTQPQQQLPTPSPSPVSQASSLQALHRLSHVGGPNGTNNINAQSRTSSAAQYDNIQFTPLASETSLSSCAKFDGASEGEEASGERCSARDLVTLVCRVSARDLDHTASSARESGGDVEERRTAAAEAGDVVTPMTRGLSTSSSFLQQHVPTSPRAAAPAQPIHALPDALSPKIPYPSKLGSYHGPHASFFNPGVILSWDFDLLNMDSHEMVKLCYDLFMLSGLVHHFDLSRKKLRAFLTAVASHHHDVPYHNLNHVVHVLHGVCLLLRVPFVQDALPAEEQLALMIAAICHDLDHDGCSNAYHVNAQSELAQIYNDISVLENHHCAMTTAIINRQECAILASLDPATRKRLRKDMLTAILSTDMSQHHALTQEFSRHPPQYDPQLEADRLLLLKVLLHASDIGSSVRPLYINDVLSRRVHLEFKALAEKEMAAGLPTTFNVDPTNPRMTAQVECNFLDYIVVPLWERLAEVVPDLQPCFQRLQHNREIYRSMTQAT